MMVREIEVHTESMAEQKLGGYSSRYRFTGKELDPLSGLYDFGARYYDPRLSVWFGVDPLAEKNFAYTPYVYTGNNPIKFIDPDGKDWYEDKCSGKMQWFDGSGKQDGFIHRGAEYQNGRNLYTTTSDGKSPLSFDNALPAVDVTAPKNEYNYPDNFSGNANRILNNIFDNKPSDEVKLRDGDKLFALTKSLQVYEKSIEIASTGTAIGGGVGLGVKALQAGNMGLALYQGLDIGLNVAQLYNDAAGKENKTVNFLSGIFGGIGFATFKKTDKGNIGGYSDIKDLLEIENNIPYLNSSGNGNKTRK